MIKEAIQKEIKLNSDEIRPLCLSSNGKYIAFIRGQHELVILQEVEDSNYQQNSVVYNFRIASCHNEFIGNRFFWVQITETELEIRIINISSMKESIDRQNLIPKNRIFFNGSLYQIIDGKIVVTDFMNESNIQVFERNYHEARTISCIYVPDPYFLIRYEAQDLCQPIPVQDNKQFQIPNFNGQQFVISQHHVITYQSSLKSIKLISYKKTTPTNATTIHIISVNGYTTDIRIYKKLMISSGEGRITTISRNSNYKIIRNQRQEYNGIYIQANYNYLSIYNIADTYGVLDLRTSSVEKYEDTKYLFIRQNRIIQFKSDTLLIHIMNT